MASTVEHLRAFPKDALSMPGHDDEIIKMKATNMLWLKYDTLVRQKDAKRIARGSRKVKSWTSTDVVLYLAASLLRCYRSPRHSVRDPPWGPQLDSPTTNINPWLNRPKVHSYSFPLREVSKCSLAPVGASRAPRDVMGHVCGHTPTNATPVAETTAPHCAPWGIPTLTQTAPNLYHHYYFLPWRREYPNAPKGPLTGTTGRQLPEMTRGGAPSRRSGQLLATRHNITPLEDVQVAYGREVKHPPA